MKAVIIFVVLFAVALGAPRPADEILYQKSDVQPESYQFAYKTSDGSSHESQGQLKNVGTDHEAIVVQGKFSFVSKEGEEFTVTYVADENGFQPQGAHLPVGLN